jgi:preprotein translocase subunit SecG
MTAYCFAAFIVTSLTLVIMAKNSNEVEKINLVPTAPITEETTTN